MQCPLRPPEEEVWSLWVSQPEALAVASLLQVQVYQCTLQHLGDKMQVWATELVAPKLMQQLKTQLKRKLVLQLAPSLARQLLGQLQLAPLTKQQLQELKLKLQLDYKERRLEKTQVSR